MYVIKHTVKAFQLEEIITSSSKKNKNVLPISIQLKYTT